MNAYTELTNILTQISHLGYIASLSHWDESCMMPNASGQFRAEANGTLELLSQQLLIAPNVKKLIEAAKNESLTTWQQANLAWIEKKHIQATATPPAMLTELEKLKQQSVESWKVCRASNDWANFAPRLDALFKLKKQIAELHSQVLGISAYDVLLDAFSPGYSEAKIDTVFTKLRDDLPALRQRIMQLQANVKTTPPEVKCTTPQLIHVSEKIATLLGFDFERGRIDISAHPATYATHPSDVRLTTRLHDDCSVIVGTMTHETGHGLYEQSLPIETATQPAGMIQSLVLHEGQALLFEKVIGSQLAFWEAAAPLVQQEFGNDARLAANNLCQHNKHVKNGLIRVDADNVSYPLHILLRYDLEKQLFNGEVTIADLPDAWDKGMQTYLNVSTKGDDRNGVMQDIHWSLGEFGYFPAYALGFALGAQLYAAFVSAHPDFATNLAKSNLSQLRNWLTENVYQHASSLPTDELMTKVTGKPLSADALLEHIEVDYLGSMSRA